MRSLTFLYWLVYLNFQLLQTVAEQPIQLTDSPNISPDGSEIIFSWRGDIWLSSIEGGAAKQLTQNPAKDIRPKFSPNGLEIAFVSNRDGPNQVFIMSADGGQPEQLTFHSEGSMLESWHPNSRQIITRGRRDHFWKRSNRFFTISTKKRNGEKLLFDAYGKNGCFSLDGKRFLFTREGEQSWRKGYRGSRASQIWQYHLPEDRTENCFTKIIHHPTSSRTPVWNNDGTGFYYVGGQSGSFNLWFFNLTTKIEKQLTFFEDDSVANPSVADSTIIFQHLFDLYRFRPKVDDAPKKLNIFCQNDLADHTKIRRSVRKATAVAFSNDGLEIVLVAGGDLWVMDTELREPIQITNTPAEEHSPVFSRDNEQIFFIGDTDGQCDIWQAQRSDKNQYWWQNHTFKLRKMTNDSPVEANLKVSPDGKSIGFTKNRGDLWIMDLESKNARRIVESWDQPEYDWSPDGKWMTYAVNDNNFNIDVWLIPIDGSKQAINITQHPYDQSFPRWSPDGKAIAFTTQRRERQLDIGYVWLTGLDEERNTRDRKMEAAIKKMEKQRPKIRKKTENSDQKKGEKTETPNTEKDGLNPNITGKGRIENKLPEVTIDLDQIHKRIRTISIKGSTETGLFWSHDSKKIAFTATVADKLGTYTIELVADKISPKLLTDKTGKDAKWLKAGNQIVWFNKGEPATVSFAGVEKKFPFIVQTEVNLSQHYQSAFDLSWRTIRDRFYDKNLGNRDWSAIRLKYWLMAGQATRKLDLTKVINLMLGELNSSHLGFYPSSDYSPKPRQDWSARTPHFGLGFDLQHNGSGLKVNRVIPNSPADRVATKIEVGETILQVDGEDVNSDIDLTAILNGRKKQAVQLTVRSMVNTNRTVLIHPISFDRVRNLLYEQWVDNNRRIVTSKSSSRLGYVHIRGMNWSSFERFEREIYEVGFGKDALVIDVRDNGGGFTTDHLLTILTQPIHAITSPRGGEQGYPEGRYIYATWRKPIVVLCNQGSFSNAEIFCHAVKTLGLGQVVGIPTAGGVISTGRKQIMDVGSLRLPFRGWFLATTGQDMELNGAIPDYIVELLPGKQVQGQDAQLNKSIQVLLEKIEQNVTQPIPLRFNSDRQKAGNR